MVYWNFLRILMAITWIKMVFFQIWKFFSQFYSCFILAVNMFSFHYFWFFTHLMWQKCFNWSPHYQCVELLYVPFKLMCYFYTHYIHYTNFVLIKLIWYSPTLIMYSLSTYLYSPCTHFTSFTHLVLMCTFPLLISCSLPLTCSFSHF